jgi:hypothetical protein
MQPSWRLTLRVFAILILLVAVIWLAVKAGLDALITLLTGLAMLLGFLAGGEWGSWVSFEANGKVTNGIR